VPKGAEVVFVPFNHDRLFFLLPGVTQFDRKEPGEESERDDEWTAKRKRFQSLLADNPISFVAAQRDTKLKDRAFFFNRFNCSAIDGDFVDYFPDLFSAFTQFVNKIFPEKY